MPKAFLITPFTAERAGNEDAELFRTVQAAVADAIKAAGVELVHPAETNAAGVIMEQVRENIIEADVVLAILTGQNPNVFLELGIALDRASRPAILIVRSRDDVPFDVKHHRYWTYGGEGELQRLSGSLKQAICETLALTPRRTAKRRPLSELTAYPFPKVSEVDCYDLLSVRKSEYVDRYPGKNPPYVPRDVDGQLTEALRRNTFILVVGPSAAGKTRTAYEALLRLDPSMSIVVPWEADDLKTLVEELEALPDLPNQSVLWLNDLERYFSNAAFSLRLLNVCELRMRVVATMRSVEYTRWKAADDEIRRKAQQVLEHAEVIDLEDRMSPREKQRAGEIYPDLYLEPGLGESFIAARHLKHL